MLLPILHGLEEKSGSSFDDLLDFREAGIHVVDYFLNLFPCLFEVLGFYVNLFESVFVYFDECSECVHDSVLWLVCLYYNMLPQILLECVLLFYGFDYC